MFDSRSLRSASSLGWLLQQEAGQLFKPRMAAMVGRFCVAHLGTPFPGWGGVFGIVSTVASDLFYLKHLIVLCIFSFCNRPS